MQNSSLFNDNDLKKRGRGIDALHQKDDRLKAHWQWTRGAGAQMPETNRRLIGQISEAEVGENIILEAISWNTYYEARVSWRTDSLISYDVDPRDAKEKNLPPLLTRVDAQRKAEQLTRQFIKTYLKELSIAGL